MTRTPVANLIKNYAVNITTIESLLLVNCLYFAHNLRAWRLYKIGRWISGNLALGLPQK